MAQFSHKTTHGSFAALDYQHEGPVNVNQMEVNCLYSRSVVISRFTSISSRRSSDVSLFGGL